MRFQCDSKAFRAALAAVGRVVASRQVIPILGSVKIVTSDSRILITASNLDMTVEMELAADVLTEGATCISHAHLSAFCAAAKADSFVIEADAKQAVVRAGKSRIVINPFDPTEFPNILPAESALVTVDRDIFLGALKFCAASCAEPSDVRYYLHGPAILEQDGRVQIWGTDGHSMHHADISAIPSIGGGGIVPAEAAAFIVAVAEKTTALSFMVGERGWHMLAPPIRAWGKVIEGTMPDMRRIAAGFSNWQDFLSAPTAELSAALAIATCGADTAGGKSRSLAITGATGGPLVLRGARGAAGVINAGRAETMTPCAADVVMMASAPLVQRALSAMPTPEVSLSCTSRDAAPALKVVPAQADRNCHLSAVVIGMRATPEELADV